MTVGLAVWEGRVSPVFDVSRQLLVVSVRDGFVLDRELVSIDTPTPAQKLERLRALDIQTLICGAISAPLQQELVACGVRVIAFVAGEIDAVLWAHAAGMLPDPWFNMPGCGGRRRRRRRRRGFGRRT